MVCRIYTPANGGTCHDGATYNIKYYEAAAAAAAAAFLYSRNKVHYVLISSLEFQRQNPYKFLRLMALYVFNTKHTSFYSKHTC